MLKNYNDLNNYLCRNYSASNQTKDYVREMFKVHSSTKIQS